MWKDEIAVGVSRHRVRMLLLIKYMTGIPISENHSGRNGHKVIPSYMRCSSTIIDGPCLKVTTPSKICKIKQPNKLVLTYTSFSIERINPSYTWNQNNQWRLKSREKHKISVKNMSIKQTQEKCKKSDNIKDMWKSTMSDEILQWDFSLCPFYDSISNRNPQKRALLSGSFISNGYG